MYGILTVYNAIVAVNSQKIVLDFCISIYMWLKISAFILDIANNIYIISFYAQILQEMFAGINS